MSSLAPFAHVEDDFLGSGETEGGGVAYVQFQNLHALLFHAGRFVNDRAAHIIEHMIELAGFAKRPHCPSAPGQAPSPVLVEVEKKTKKRVVRTYGSMRACLLVHMFCCIGPKKPSCQGHTCLLDARGLGKRACGRSAPVRSEGIFPFFAMVFALFGQVFCGKSCVALPNPCAMKKQKGACVSAVGNFSLPVWPAARPEPRNRCSWKVPEH